MDKDSSSIENLKKMAQAVIESHTDNERLKALLRALSQFSKEEGRIEKVYREIENSNQQLQEKVVEFGLMTEYLDTILLNISQGVIFVTHKGEVTTFNTAAEKVLGILTPIVLFDPYWEHFDDHLFGFSMKDALKKQTPPENLTLTINNAKGEKRDIEIETKFINESGGSHSSVPPLQGIIILIRDITEMKRLQTIAQRNNRMKELGEMAASVAHEIRNPLGGIKGFSALLLRDLKDRPEMQHMVRQIEEGADAMSQLVAQILEHTKPKQPVIQPTDMKAFLKETINFIEVDPSINQTIKIELETTDLQTPWFIDPQMIKACLLNLVVNASQAMASEGVVKIRASEKQGNCVIEIEDTGHGIKEENLEKIFSPFFTTRAEGTGFGLAEVYKVVLAHDGEISVSSKVGKGTRFTMQIPTGIHEE